MPPRRPTSPTWTTLKARLTGLTQEQLLALVGDLYRANAENRAFLHTRFELGDDPLAAYRKTIERWACPDVYRGQRPSVAKARKAVTDYRHAIGRPEGLAELMTLYCEQASMFAADVAGDDEGFLDALARMFENALKTIRGLDAEHRVPLLDRLRVVRDRSRQFGYGAGDAIEELWAGLAHGS